MVTLMVMVMAMVMERGKLKPLLLLKPMLSQVIIIMATLTDMAMDMDMARGRLPPVIIIMVMDMVDTVMDMDMDMDMERGRLRLPLAIIIMVTDMVDMVMDMVMDTMVKQYLFISFSKFCCIHWNLLESSQQKHRPLFKKNRNSFFEIKRT